MYLWKKQLEMRLIKNLPTTLKGFFETKLHTMINLTLCSPCILTLTNQASDDGRVTAETCVECSEQKIMKIKSAFVGWKTKDAYNVLF